ncbi:MAG: putative TIM-barrel fold metal-dependent hydrolase [Gammaproteobacteria bacterium]|jgi:predicted TIM-barrel fold metal-dependent hydrolase
MAYLHNSKSAAVRAKLSHPVIDADGHWLEPVPIFLDFLHAEGGVKMVDRWRAAKSAEDGWYELDAVARRHQRLRRPTWWAEPANTLDRATAMVPGLMYERLDDFGVDYAIVYSTLGLVQATLPDDEMRAAVCRALNTMNAELFAPYADRMTPVAVIPSVTPDEAIAETRYAVQTLGLKTIMIANHVRRPVPAQLERAKDAAAAGYYVDFLALDSPYDYDPFWQLCVDLKLAVTAHSSAMGWQNRSAVENFTFNHIGHFAEASHGFTKALLFGGVLQRFPDLRFGLLEGGAGWACNLLTDTIGHWQKRHAQAVQANARPSNLDLTRLGDLLAEYGGARYQNKMDDILASPSTLKPFYSAQFLTDREAPYPVDDFARANINSADDLRRLFAERFFFGCEADDPSAAWAFHHAHRLNPMFSSDVGHFDVIDMSEVLEEAYELVDHELISVDAFKEFTFTNAAKLHTAQNPQYFDGTVVEQAVRETLALK